MQAFGPVSACSGTARSYAICSARRGQVRNRGQGTRSKTTGGTVDLTDVAALAQPTGEKIMLLVLDGVGGLPLEPGGLTELETARTPNMDGLLANGDAGLHVPVATGVTPGSGPGSPGAVRVRSAAVPGRPWRPRGPRRGVSAAAGRRRGTRQSVHRRRRGCRHRSAGRAHSDGRGRARAATCSTGL